MSAMLEPLFYAMYVREVIELKIQNQRLITININCSIVVVYL